jgi:5'(3')-deoxyribonucleotidase
MIAIDMDHVMADTGVYITQWVNDQFGTSYEGESFPSLLEGLPDRERQIMVEHVAEGSLMRDLPRMDDCVTVMEKLAERYCLVICTAAMEFPNTIAPKIAWLEEYFPFLDSQLFVFCGYKQVMGTHYLIDDSPKHFTGYAGMPLLYTAAHNHQVTAYQRVDNWSDIASYFDV